MGALTSARRAAETMDGSPLPAAFISVAPKVARSTKTPSRKPKSPMRLTTNALRPA
jgi:hypothetical protein